MERMTLHDARARFDEVVDRASRGEPQLVTRSGEDAVVIVRASDDEASPHREESLVEFFARSPHREVSVDVERAKDAVADAPTLEARTNDRAR